jgi:hypothetical protein
VWGGRYWRLHSKKSNVHHAIAGLPHCAHIPIACIRPHTDELTCIAIKLQVAESNLSCRLHAMRLEKLQVASSMQNARGRLAASRLPPAPAQEIRSHTSTLRLRCREGCGACRTAASSGMGCGARLARRQQLRARAH